MTFPVMRGKVWLISGAFCLSAAFRPAFRYVELNLTSRSIAFYDSLRRQEPKLAVERSFGKHSRKRNAYKSSSIFERRTEWILILAGMFMGLAFILMQVRSPMLIAVRMYLPIETSFVIFVGGAFKGFLEGRMERKKIGGEVKERATNTGTLLASGLIAGEALVGILFAPWPSLKSSFSGHLISRPT